MTHDKNDDAQKPHDEDGVLHDPKLLSDEVRARFSDYARGVIVEAYNHLELPEEVAEGVEIGQIPMRTAMLLRFLGAKVHEFCQREKICSRCVGAPLTISLWTAFIGTINMNLCTRLGWGCEFIPESSDGTQGTMTVMPGTMTERELRDPKPKAKAAPAATTEEASPKPRFKFPESGKN